MGWLTINSNLTKMEILARLFPYGKTLAGMRQTQAAQTVLQSREGPATSCMAILLGLMGVGMSGYSSRQLTLHYKPSRNLFR
ncbi:hypothetical protein OJAV_G00229670 [Oryzias javanicus]|uniref:Uncharacterized protein n=1 Tax=Oryzias javanicus TaxID=123683 RepID=A0A437BZP7_ORYJA|nr:hypothetical protein OJAV_G00229670 [Oryzias javanicus]